MFARSVSFHLKPGRTAEFTRLLDQVVEGTPQVQTYEVSNSTFHKIAAHATI